MSEDAHELDPAPLERSKIMAAQIAMQEMQAERDEFKRELAWARAERDDAQRMLATAMSTANKVAEQRDALRRQVSKLGTYLLESMCLIKEVAVFKDVDFGEDGVWQAWEKARDEALAEARKESGT
jgi:uncharacterized coiled-coil DUF342 family protein